MTKRLHQRRSVTSVHKRCLYLKVNLSVSSLNKSNKPIIDLLVGCELQNLRYKYSRDICLHIPALRFVDSSSYKKKLT